MAFLNTWSCPLDFEVSSSFQSYINDILRDCLNVFATAYIDDILIFSKSKKEHQKHVHTVLIKLQGAGLQLAYFDGGSSGRSGENFGRGLEGGRQKVNALGGLRWRIDLRAPCGDYAVSTPQSDRALSQVS